MGLTAGLSAAKTMISGTYSVLQMLSNGSKAAAVSTELLTLAQQASNDADLASMATGRAKALVTALNTGANKEQIASILAGMGVKNADALAETILTVAKEKGAAAALKMVASNVALAASEYAVLWPLLLIAAAIAAVIAVIAIWDAATVSAAEKTERLTENVENMKEAASEAKEEAEGLRDAFEEYKGLKTTLEECTVGTTDWKNAMEGVRTAIDSILETYPDLAKIADIMVWDEATQSYILDNDKVEEYIKGQEDASEAMEYGSKMAEGMLSKEKGNP
jgi:hypothetical protein